MSAPMKFPRPLVVESLPPAWIPILSALRLFRSPADRGLGDTVARIIGPVGGDAFKAWHLKTFGAECGCEGRQEDLNRWYPYDNLTT